MSSLRTTIKNQLHGEMYKYMAYNPNRLYFHFQTMVFIKMYITIFSTSYFTFNLMSVPRIYIFQFKKRTKHTTFRLHLKLVRGSLGTGRNFSLSIRSSDQIGSSVVAKYKRELRAAKRIGGLHQ